jgi:glycosyltransferase involved in cell wall biosynthesis
MEPYINAFEGRPTKPKKRVLFVVTQSELGGAQQFIFQLAGRLDKEIYDVTVAVGRDGDRALSHALADLKVPVLNIASLRRDFRPFADPRAVLEIKNLVRKLNPDTLFLCSSKAGFIGSLAVRLGGPQPRVIYRIGGWTFNDPWPTWKRNLWLTLEKLSAPWKDLIIVNNLPDLEQAKELGIKPRQEIVLVHNGIDPFRLNLLPRDEARAKLSKILPADVATDLANKKIIGTLANFYPAKGLEYLIRAAAQLNDPGAVVGIIGEGRERPKLEALIKKLGLEDKVILFGRLTEASRYLSAFDIFVLPSIKEGFPWSVLEAMSAKLPVIATRVGAIPEIIQDGVNGYVVLPKDPDQIAERINVLLANEALVKEMGIQAHQRVLFSFPLEKMVNEIQELL